MLYISACSIQNGTMSTQFSSMFERACTYNHEFDTFPYFLYANQLTNIVWRLFIRTECGFLMIKARIIHLLSKTKLVSPSKHSIDNFSVQFFFFIIIFTMYHIFLIIIFFDMCMCLWMNGSSSTLCCAWASVGTSSVDVLQLQFVFGSVAFVGTIQVYSSYM